MTKKVMRAKTVGSRPPKREPKTLRAIRVGDGMPPLTKLMEELDDMKDVLIGRVPPPQNFGVLSLMEIASAYHARALEMTMTLQQWEREGTILKGSAHYKFRTGELRTFVDMAKAAADLGSRRLSAQQLEFDQERFGRDL